MEKNNKIIIVAAIIVLAIIAIGFAFSGGLLAPKETLKIATTTSLDDTGLLNELEKDFEEKNPEIDVQIVSAGTGQALEYGKKGDVDLVMVHSKKQETEFLKQGYGTNRTIFAYNYFYIVGPSNDTAGVKGKDATTAFKSIQTQGETNPENVKFVSRGDNSGTHNREFKIWDTAGIDYNTSVKGKEWYIESGKGMGDTLIIANEKQAYTISDSGTFLAFNKNISLVPLITEGKDLINVYSIIPINSKKFADTNTEAADKWTSFIISKEGQDKINKYGKDKYGKPLFIAYTGSEDPT